MNKTIATSTVILLLCLSVITVFNIESIPLAKATVTPQYYILKANFHAHTTYSDGNYTPTNLVDIYSSAGYDSLAITDHNTTDGYSEAKTEGDAKDIVIIRGEEVTTKWTNNNTEHWLGLFITSVVSPPIPCVDPTPYLDQVNAQSGLNIIAHPWTITQSPWNATYVLNQSVWYSYFGNTTQQNGWEGSGYAQNSASSEVTAIANEGYTVLFDHDFHGTTNDIAKLTSFWTYVMAANKTEAGVKDALLNHRTVGCYSDGLYGSAANIALYHKLKADEVYANFNSLINNSTIWRQPQGLSDKGNTIYGYWIRENQTVGCDINHDGKIGLGDLARLAIAYNTVPANSTWNPYADINCNGQVALSDLSLLAQHYNQHGSSLPAKVVMLDGCIHGREAESATLLYNLALFLSNSSDQRAYDMIHSTQYFIIPIVNIDRFGTPDSTGAGTRKDANEVDINSNFAYNWSNAGSSDPANYTYRGPSANSENETQILRNIFTKTLYSGNNASNAVYIDLHCGGGWTSYNGTVYDTVWDNENQSDLTTEAIFWQYYTTICNRYNTTDIYAHETGNTQETNTPGASVNDLGNSTHIPSVVIELFNDFNNWTAHHPTSQQLNGSMLEQIKCFVEGAENFLTKNNYEPVIIQESGFDNNLDGTALTVNGTVVATKLSDFPYITVVQKGDTLNCTYPDIATSNYTYESEHVEQYRFFSWQNFGSLTNINAPVYATMTYLIQWRLVVSEDGGVLAYDTPNPTNGYHWYDNNTQINCTTSGDFLYQNNEYTISMWGSNYHYLDGTEYTGNIFYTTYVVLTFTKPYWLQWAYVYG